MFAFERNGNGYFDKVKVRVKENRREEIIILILSLIVVGSIVSVGLWGRWK